MKEFLWVLLVVNVWDAQWLGALGVSEDCQSRGIGLQKDPVLVLELEAWMNSILVFAGQGLN